MTFTAMRLCLPAENGSDSVPENAARLSASITVRSERAMLCHAFLFWEKRLRRTEGAAVVIRIQKPRRHFIRLRRFNSIIDRIVGIHAFHFDAELPIVSPHHLRSRRADDSEELIAVRLPKQVSHRDIRRNFREMRLDAPMLSGNYRLCLRFKTETENAEQQHLVLMTRRR